MVDKINPTNQFHPYLPPTVTPNSETRRSGLSSMMHKVGLESQVSKARDYARRNPGALLAGLAALVISAGLLRGRR